jgi:hypothetical protein
MCSRRDAERLCSGHASGSAALSACEDRWAAAGAVPPVDETQRERSLARYSSSSNWNSSSCRWF